MKAQTQIEQAVKACYDAYADYARVVENIPVIPSFPKVSWVRGSLKNEATGWMVDGRLYHGTADEVVSHWHKQAARWTTKTRKYIASQSVSSDNTQETGEGAGGGGYPE